MTSASVGGGHKATSTATRLRVMTWNVGRLDESEGAAAQDRRMKGMCELAASEPWDLLALQEVTSTQWQQLELAFPDHWTVAFERDPGGPSERLGFILRPERWIARCCEVRWLSNEPTSPGSVGWDAAYPRIAVVLEIIDAATGHALTAVNVHLDKKGAMSRGESAALLVHWLRHANPSLVLGDFNDSATSSTARTLQSGGFQLGTGDEPTFQSFGRDLPGAPRDHIYYRGDLSPLTASILSSHFCDLWISDHDVVKQTFILNAQTSAA